MSDPTGPASLADLRDAIALEQRKFMNYAENTVGQRISRAEVYARDADVIGLLLQVLDAVAERVEDSEQR